MTVLKIHSKSLSCAWLAWIFAAQIVWAHPSKYELNDAPVGDFEPPDYHLPRPSISTPSPLGFPTPSQTNELVKEPQEQPATWQAWHKRVAETIYLRFSRLSNAAFSRSRPLLAEAQYEVTRDGRIVNAKLLRKCWNPIFNTLVLAVINSINHDTKLPEFPPGSTEESIVKTGTFTQNYGIGDYPPYASPVVPQSSDPKDK